MSVYGNTINTHDSFFVLSEYIERSIIEVNEMFEFSVTEDTDETGVTVYKNYYAKEPEKVKETILQKIVSIIKTIVKTIKEAIEKVIKTIKDFYTNNNMIDNIISKYSDKVTFENIEKAKAAGWVGVPKALGIVKRYVNIGNIGSFDFNLSNSFDFSAAIDKIHNAKNNDDAHVEYNKFKEELESYNKSTKSEFAPSIYGLLGPSQAKLLSDTGSVNGLFMWTVGGNDIEEGKDDSHYYPKKHVFETTKDMAEKGQATIKQWKADAGRVCSEGKIANGIELDKYKSYRSSNKSSKDVDYTFEMLYHKANFEYKSAQLKRFAKSAKVAIQILGEQHRRAITIYINYYNGIKKYALG